MGSPELFFQGIFAISKIYIIGSIWCSALKLLIKYRLCFKKFVIIKTDSRNHITENFIFSIFLHSITIFIHIYNGIFIILRKPEGCTSIGMSKFKSCTTKSIFLSTRKVWSDTKNSFAETITSFTSTIEIRIFHH